jgi:hypothetical protein
MPNLPELKLSAVNGDDPKGQIEALIGQLNEWGRLISNENKTRVMRGDFDGEKNLYIGELPGENTQGIQLSDSGVTTTITASSIVQNDGTNDRLFLGNE